MVLTRTEHISIANEMEKAGEVQAWFNMVAEAWSISTRTLFHLDLVINEILSNVLMHAFDESQEGQIKVQMEHQGDVINLLVSDTGKPFNPFGMAPAELPSNLAEASLGGLGIHLMKQVGIDHKYWRENGHNHVSFNFKEPA